MPTSASLPAPLLGAASASALLELVLCSAVGVVLFFLAFVVCSFVPDACACGLVLLLLPSCLLLGFCALPFVYLELLEGGSVVYVLHNWKQKGMYLCMFVLPQCLMRVRVWHPLFSRHRLGVA